MSDGVDDEAIRKCSWGHEAIKFRPDEYEHDAMIGEIMRQILRTPDRECLTVSLSSGMDGSITLTDAMVPSTLPHLANSLNETAKNTPTPPNPTRVPARLHSAGIEEVQGADFLVPGVS